MKEILADTSNVFVTCCKNCQATSNTNSLAPYLPLIVALITAFFALRQMRSNNIMQTRLKWIEELKENISEFMSVMNSINIAIVNLHEEYYELDPSGVDFQTQKKDLVDKHYEPIYQNREKVDKYLTLIELSLDDSIELHVSLNAKLNEFADKARKTYQMDNMESLESIKKECIQLSKEVIKKEWRRARGFFCDDSALKDLTK